MKDTLVKIAENIRGIAKEIEQIVAEPKEQKPLYVVGQEVWWSGRAYQESAHKEHSRKVTITEVFPGGIASDPHWHYRVEDLSCIIDESELSPILKSQHKRGERFDDEHDYAGEMRVPDPNVDIWEGYSLFNVKYVGSHLVKEINHGFREILIPHRDRVGEIIIYSNKVPLKAHNLPCPCRFKIIRKDNHVNRGEVFLHKDESGVNFSGYDTGWHILGGLPYRWILKPIIEDPTVHVWDKDGKSYEFEVAGEPDLQRIYRETIGKGALAAWIKHDKHTTVFGSDKIRRSELFYGHGERMTYSNTNWSDWNIFARLQQAIADYVAKQKDAWTRTIGGLRVRAYELNGNKYQVRLCYRMVDGSDAGFTPVPPAICQAIGIPIKPYVEGEEMRYPE